MVSLQRAELSRFLGLAETIYRIAGGVTRSGESREVMAEYHWTQVETMGREVMAEYHWTRVETMADLVAEARYFAKGQLGKMVVVKGFRRQSGKYSVGDHVLLSHVRFDTAKHVVALGAGDSHRQGLPEERQNATKVVNGRILSESGR
ncbi:hypothetical protein NE237_006900 [Protea cynaroides]|uniref:Uncharacterized protein n=1 Tax=Protea cynaroides TaxID=273540 RepID=A0A9Q0KNY7_9MAGN|nr:hypothetical protein NE237_006900 [Protea cynaroides]